MNFLTETTTYPSAVHGNIYAFARGITPLERSLQTTTNPACQAFHSFIMAMLSDMYDNPLAYGLPVGMLENFCGDKKVNYMKQKFPTKTKTILSQTRNAVHGYMVLLFKLAKHGTLTGNKLTVSTQDLAAIQKAVSTPSSPISLEQRLNALSRVGLLAKDNVFTSVHYPHMFTAMKQLANKTEKLSGFDFFAFTTLEFRNIESKYKPTHDDYFHPLTAEQQKQAYALHHYASTHKMKPTINTYWKVDYKYKGSQVMCIGTEGDHERILTIRITGTYNWEDAALINDRLAKESPAFQNCVLRHIWRCDACATTHLGQFVTVLGKKQRVCGGGIIGFRWFNPSDEDIEIIQKLIQFRCEILDEIAK